MIIFVPMEGEKPLIPFIISRIGTLHKKLLKECDKIFRELGFPLEMDQIPVLLMLYYNNGAAQQELVFSLQRDKASINRTVTFLTKAGITEVVPLGDSKRRTFVQLTPHGKQLAKKADVILKRFEAGLSASLTEKELQQFTAIMQKLIHTDIC